MHTMPTLILSPRRSDDSQALWRAAVGLRWGVERLASWRVPEELLGVPEPVLFIESLLGPPIAAAFGLRLLGPPDDWLPRLPERFRRREVSLTTLGAARGLAEPAFIKPPNDKSFPARVWRGAELPEGYDQESPVLVGEVVTWEKEFRCFVLDRRPRTISVYLRQGELQREEGFVATDSELAEAEALVLEVCADPAVDLPRAAVLDVGVIAGRGWAVVEQNAACGSGIYGCDPAVVLEVLRHAAVPA
jgi:hypothetical protein